QFIGSKLSWTKEQLDVEILEHSRGPGNIVAIEVECSNVTEVFVGFGERGVRAEAVAEKAVQQARRYLASDAAVGEYLADQLIIPMAMAGAGSFTTRPLSRHATTNIDVVRKFLPVSITTTQMTGRMIKLAVGEEEIEKPD